MPQILLRCPQCDTEIGYTEEKAAYRYTCPACKTVTQYSIDKKSGIGMRGSFPPQQPAWSAFVGGFLIFAGLGNALFLTELASWGLPLCIVGGCFLLYYKKHKDIYDHYFKLSEFARRKEHEEYIKSQQ